jgi:hypothetical protein
MDQSLTPTRRHSPASPQNYALARLTAVISGYPTTRFTEEFLAQAGAILERYPAECIAFVTDANTGVQAKYEFLTLAAIKKCCEAYMAPIYARQHGERVMKAQLEERERLERPRDPRVLAAIANWQKERAL